MARLQGMDTDEARQTSRQMDNNAAQVGQAFSGLVARIGGLQWTGRDFDAFRQDMDSFAPQVTGAVNSLEDNAQVLRTQADRQDAVSS